MGQQLSIVLNDALNRYSERPKDRAVILEHIASTVGQPRAYIDAVIGGQQLPTRAEIIVLTLLLPVSAAQVRSAMHKDALHLGAAPR